MIAVYPISKEVKKYCSHCDSPAVFEILFCNPKVIQQSASGCLCDQCMARLKTEVIKATAPNSDYAAALRVRKEFIKYVNENGLKMNYDDWVTQRLNAPVAQPQA